ncbi:hypothetical protein [Brevibacillus daliensis]|uniref:hypothetical protein n=1 Tax=Brevibacillus daliensis TaxID=2892995 RepID=UPI001E3322E5|nr:hypothetical protein [Brevibacillus daliensis]
MPSNEHVLVVGRTGMLKGMVKHFLERGKLVSVVARNEHTHQQLAVDLSHLPGNINPIPVDYHDIKSFIHSVTHSINQHGPISLSVNWIHSYAKEAPYALATLLNQTSPDSTYVRLLGSAAAHPDHSFNDHGLFRTTYPYLVYREIILGFIVEDSRSRWLTHHEICEGIIEKIHVSQARSVIGTVTPWSFRP